jgi:hypothetical protein
MKKILLPFIFLGLGMGSQADSCPSPFSTVEYTGEPVRVHISSQVPTQVIFPEATFGGLADVAEGLIVEGTPHPNKLSFQLESEGYSGVFTADAANGQTYVLMLVNAEDCPDRLITIDPPSKASDTRATSSVTYRNKRKLDLMGHMLVYTDIPKGYRSVSFSHLANAERIVMRYGNVAVKLVEQWVGPRYTGTFFEIENRGRTPFKFDISGINYSDYQVAKTLGDVRQVAMLPTSHVLAPSPEAVSQSYSGTNKGLLYIVSENSDER